MDKHTFVIGDVHGCFHTMMNLINTLPKDANLIFVGDLCDKGLYTKEVISFIKENKHQSILGNHDMYMIKHLKNALKGQNNAWNTKALFSGDATVNSYKACEESIIDEHIAWLSQLPTYLEFNHYFITHGFGLPYYQRKDITTYHPILRSNRLSSIRYREDWEKEYEMYNIINIFGHDTFDEVVNGDNYYGIDTGCKYGQKLTAIELGSMHISDVPVDKRDIASIDA